MIELTPAADAHVRFLAAHYEYLGRDAALDNLAAAVSGAILRIGQNP